MGPSHEKHETGGTKKKQRRQSNSDSAGNTNYHLDLPRLRAGHIHAKKKQRRSRDEQGGCSRCRRPKTNVWNSAFAATRTKAHGESSREEKKSNGHTFLFIGLCMQQASKARAEQKSLVGGLGRLVLSSLRRTAAHLPDWGRIRALNRVAAGVSGRVFPLS